MNHTDPCQAECSSARWVCATWWMNWLNRATGHSKWNHVQLNMSVSVSPILLNHIRTHAASALSSRTQLAAPARVRTWCYSVRQTKQSLQGLPVLISRVSIHGYEGVFWLDPNTAVLDWLRWLKAQCARQFQKSIKNTQKKILNCLVFFHCFFFNVAI